MSKMVVLGAGMVGREIAADLAKQHDITSADYSTQALENVKSIDSSINTFQLDATDVNLLQQTISPLDLMVCAIWSESNLSDLKGKYDSVESESAELLSSQSDASMKYENIRYQIKELSNTRFTLRRNPRERYHSIIILYNRVTI
ncbi:MAG: saccharopine dehydrogenase NADP-binding domain-containing protein [Flavobacteriales bacterium]|nr:saccharopine dehydrogenase NADP-binding domain-containing protein [Flavobacteriales bacterium]